MWPSGDPKDMASTDEELVARSRGGDLDSFNQLVLRWERPIYALAYRVIGREEDARDVAQETFLRAFRALSGFKGQAKFSSWLYRITLNLCRDWIRRERRTPVAQAPEGVDLVELASEAEPAESIENLVARRELGRAVAKAMAMLPDDQRTAIVLKEYHGLTFQEIADLLDCPLEHREDTAVSGAHRAAQTAGAGRGGEHFRRSASRCVIRNSSSATSTKSSATASARSSRRHLSDCAECRQGLAELRGTRQLLASWAPPQPEFNFHIVRGAAPPAAPAAPRRRFAFVPQWALSAAAALLLIAGAAAVANLEVRYGSDGLVVRTGWMQRGPRRPVAPAATRRERRAGCRRSPHRQNN